MANVGFKGIDVRQTGNQLVFRASLKDSAGAILATGTTSLYLFELQSDGTLKSYDFNDNTFKTTALTTANVAMTHRTGNNATYNTGLWSYSLGTLTGFTSGGVYFAQIVNTGASPAAQEREFQFGSAEGDLVVTAGAAGLAYVQSDATKWLTGTIPAPNVAGVPKVDLVDWLGVAPNALQSGRVDTYLGAIGSAAAQQIAKLIASMSGKIWFVAKKDSAGNAAADTNDGKSWDTPFLTVFKAKSVAADGDLIRVGAGTFAEANNRIDLSLGHTAAVHLFGAGVGVTIIDSTVVSTSGPCIEVDSSIVKDLTITALVAAPTLQFPLGFTNSSRDCKPWIENVEIIAYSDGFYTENNTGAGRHFRSKNCRIRSNYDCCNFVDGTPWEMWECDYKAEGAFSAFGKHRAIASAGNGTVHSGKLVAIHNSTNNQYAVAVEAGNPLGSDSAEVMIMSGVHLSATCPGGSNAFDLIANHFAGGPSATIIVGDVVGSGINGWVTNGGAGYSEQDNGSVTYRTTSMKAAGISYVGLVISSTLGTATLGAGAAQNSVYKGQTFQTTGNTGAGQARRITSHVAGVVTFDRPLDVAIDATTNYVIEKTNDASLNSVLQVAASNASATLLIAPTLATLNNPRYGSKDLAPIAQGSAPTDAWTLVDSTGAAVNLGTNTVRLVGYLDTDNLPDNPYDNVETPKFQYQTGGSGITVSGSGTNTNVVTLLHSSNTTSIIGPYKYWLWDITQNIVLQAGNLPIVPASKSYP